MLVSEIYAIVYRVNIAIAIGSTIDMITERLLLSKVLIIVYTNLQLLYNYLIKLGTIKEKQLIINIIALREAYKKQQIIEIQ